MKKNIIVIFVLFLLFAIPVFVSSQLPANWTKLPGGTLQTLHDVAAFSSDTLFIIDEEGNIHSTFDGGNTWKKRNPQTGKELKFNALRVNKNLQTIIASGDDNAVYRSENMGESWELTFSGFADAPVSLYAITDDGSNYDEQIVYIVGQKGTILKSINDGVDWEKMELNVGANQDLRFVSFLNADTGFVANENGIIRTFDGGNSWKVVSTGGSITALKSRGKFKAGKALAETVKSIGNSGGGIQTSTDYGTTWTKDSLATPCDLLATGGVVFDKNQCENLHKGLLVHGGGGGNGNANRLFMLSGNTFKGVLQPKWENVNMEGIQMVMRTIDNQALIAETVTDSNGRFDLEIPSSFSGNVEVVARQAWDPNWCPRPLPPDEIILEPIEECDESTIQLSIINPKPVTLNDLTLSGDSWLAVGNGGVVLISTDPPDDDGDGFPELWSKQNSRTTKDLLAATARGIEKTDIRRGAFAVGESGTIITTQAPGFEINSPSKGDSLCAGSEITINWSGGNPTWNVLISIIDVNTWTVAAVLNSNTVNDGNEIWNIPLNFPTGTYQIYVQEVNYATWVYGEIFTINNCPDQPDCILDCENNLLQNHNFNNNTVYGPMPSGSTANWVRSWSKTVYINGYHGESPDLGSVACNMPDTVGVGMWGNQAIGESIEQELAVPFQPGKKYAVSFSAKWSSLANRPYPVQFEFRASTAPLTNPGDGVLIGISDLITTPEQWVTLSLPDWISPSSNLPSGTFPVLTVSATNQSSALHPDSTSYGIISAICITDASVTGNSEIDSQADGFKLGNSYPNPFKQTTLIEYTVPHSEKVTIKIFDLYGREIETLVNKVIHPGIYQIEWDAAGLPAGIYLYRMQAGRFIHTKRTLLTE